MATYSELADETSVPDDSVKQSYGDLAKEVESFQPPKTSAPAEKPRSTVSKVLGAEVGPFESAIKMGTGTVAAAPASLYQFLSGDPENAAKIQQALTYQPRTEEGKKLSDIVESPLDPLMWPGMITHKIGEITGSPRTEAAANLALLVAGARGAKGKPGAPKPSEAPVPEGFDSNGLPEDPTVLHQAIQQSEPVKNQMSPDAAAKVEAARQKLSKMADISDKPAIDAVEEDSKGIPDNAEKQKRVDVLKRVGIDSNSLRKSAIEGDRFQSGIDYQISNLDVPAGKEARSVFEAEKNALDNHAQNIIRQTGGTIGNGQLELNARGKTIDAPFSAMSDYFDKQTKAAYDAAKERSQNSYSVNLQSLKDKLNDPEIKDYLVGTNQENFLKVMQSKIAAAEKDKPAGISVSDAETLRKSINQFWDQPQLRGTIGRLTSAIDDDVARSAGEDVYKQARETSKLKSRILDNDAVSSLFGKNAYDKTKRNTSYEDIPNKIHGYDAESFSKIMDTLDSAPESIKPLAQKAKAEIQAIYANNIHEMGQKSAQPPARKLNQYINSNSLNLTRAFKDRPDLLAKIKDHRDASNILNYDANYKGAAAQAQNLVKSGAATALIPKAGSVAGRVLTGGTDIGAQAGEKLGSIVSGRAADKAALEKFRKERMVRLQDISKSPAK